MGPIVAQMLTVVVISLDVTAQPTSALVGPVAIALNNSSVGGGSAPPTDRASLSPISPISLTCQVPGWAPSTEYIIRVSVTTAVAARALPSVRVTSSVS